MRTKISASILSADPMNLGQAVKNVESAGVDFIHVDVMDGHFVPNLTMGPFIVKGIKEITNVPLDIHLMIDNPEMFIKSFAEVATSDDIITFHIETSKEPERVVAAIKDYGLLAGVALNPLTPAESIKGLMESVDLILVMTVNPGFSGQKFINDAMPKLNSLSKVVDKHKLLSVDGGVTVGTVPIAIENGANMIAAASAIFKPVDVNLAVKDLRDAANNKLICS